MIFWGREPVVSVTWPEKERPEPGEDGIGSRVLSFTKIIGTMSLTCGSQAREVTFSSCFSFLVRSQINKQFVFGLGCGCIPTLPDLPPSDVDGDQSNNWIPCALPKLTTIHAARLLSSYSFSPFFSFSSKLVFIPSFEIKAIRSV